MHSFEALTMNFGYLLQHTCPVKKHYYSFWYQPQGQLQAQEGGWELDKIVKSDVPGIFWSYNFLSWNFLVPEISFCYILPGKFLSWNFVPRKLHGFHLRFSSYYVTHWNKKEQHSQGKCKWKTLVSPMVGCWHFLNLGAVAALQQTFYSLWLHSNQY